MDTRNLVEIIKDKKLTSKERIEQVNEFIKNVTDPKILETPHNGNTALMAAAKLGYSDCVQVLIDAKADVAGRPEEYLLSPIHCAAHNGKAECVKLLIEAKAKLNETNIVGATPLGSATGNIARTGDQQECVRLLLAAGAEINLEYPPDSSIPLLYEILLKCDQKDESTQLAFQTLLRINEKEKECRVKAGQDKDSLGFSRSTLNKDELKIIEKILKKSEETPLNSSRFFSLEKPLEVKPKEAVNSLRCLIM